MRQRLKLADEGRDVRVSHFVAREREEHGEYLRRSVAQEDFVPEGQRRRSAAVARAVAARSALAAERERDGADAGSSDPLADGVDWTALDPAAQSARGEAYELARLRRQLPRVDGAPRRGAPLPPAALREDARVMHARRAAMALHSCRVEARRFVPYTAGPV